MKKLAIVLGFAMSFPIFGQDYPVNQVFVGATASGTFNPPPLVLMSPDFAHSLTTRDGSRLGTEGSFSHNFNRWFGLKADFSSYFQKGSGAGIFNFTPQQTTTDRRVYNFEFGPEFRLTNRTRFTPFVHGLAGVAHVHADFDTSGPAVALHSEDSRNGASLVFGGGVDTRIFSRASIRLGMDYNPTFLGAPYAGTSGIQNNLRLNLGVVLHSRYDH